MKKMKKLFMAYKIKHMWTKYINAKHTAANLIRQAYIQHLYVVI